MTKILYTDGACSGNPGPGGWAVIALENNHIIKKWGGFVDNTTNNRMELMAAIEALKFLLPNEPAKIFTDSEYLRKGITTWLENWKKKGWKTANKKPVKNQNLWKTLDSLNNTNIQWFYVAGHTGDDMNELCDKIAKRFITTKQKRAIIK